MATQKNTRPFHEEHPHSGFIDSESTLGTLYNVSNIMGLVSKNIDIADLDPVDITGLETIYKECLKAVAFEAVRLAEGEQS